jgi:drug/metabolite transporter (DMT)-like permease
MDSQKIPILLNCLAAVLGAFGQYFYKKGSEQLSENLLNLNILLGILMFCGVMAFFVVSYKMGGRISIVYPFYATTFIWGTLIGVFMEKEVVGPLYYVGLLLLLSGLSLIAWQVGETA